MKNSPRLFVSRVTSQNNAGDGFYVYDGSDDALFRYATASENDRDGVTLGGAVSRVTAVSSSFLHNGQSGWHSEGSGNNDAVTLTHCLFSGNTGFAVTMSGVSAVAPGHNHQWIVTDNEIDGPVAMVWVDDVLFSGNRGVNDSSLASVLVYRAAARIRIEDNQLSATGVATNG